MQIMASAGFGAMGGAQNSAKIKIIYHTKNDTHNIYIHVATTKLKQLLSQTVKYLKK